MWRHGELHHYAACRWINEIYVIKWCPEWMLKFSNTDIKPLGPLLNYMTVIATAGFSSGRCLGVCLQICALKLSLELVVRIFVHIPSNSEMNMIIVSIAYKMIYYTSYIKFQHTWRWQLFVHWHQLFTIFWFDWHLMLVLHILSQYSLSGLHLILTPRSISFSIGGVGVNPPTERV